MWRPRKGCHKLPWPQTRGHSKCGLKGCRHDQVLSRCWRNRGQAGLPAALQGGQSPPPLESRFSQITHFRNSSADSQQTQTRFLGASDGQAQLTKHWAASDPGGAPLSSPWAVPTVGRLLRHTGRVAKGQGPR